MIKHILPTLILAVLASSPAKAQQISKDEAAAIAKNFWTSSSSSMHKVKSNAVPQLAYTAKKNSTTMFYVFNNANDEGFVIVGGDKTAQQILGYSDNGSFNYDTVPENVKWWLSQYETQIQEGINNSSTIVRKAASTRSDVQDLITTKWNQTYPYNKFVPCPPGKEGKFVTGCVATAMSQIMKKFNYPNRGIGEKSYLKTFNETDTVTFSADFGNTKYDWSNMLDSYSNGYNTEQADAVARLIYQAGVALNTDFGITSSAKDMSLGTAIIDNFGYDKGISYMLREDYTDDDWTNTIYSELVAGRPVYYSGQSNNSGHGFVIHGYNATTDKFSINWGWGGYCDGQFTLIGSNILKPGGSGTGGAGSSASYSSDQAILTGIRPNVGNDYVWQANMSSKYPYTMSVDGSSTTYIKTDAASGNKLLHFRFTPFNKSLVSTGMSFGLQFIDEDTKQSKIIENIYTAENLAVNSAYTLERDVNTSIFEYNGTYKVYPVFRLASSTSSSDWKKVSYPISWDIPTVEIGNAADPEKINVNFQISASAMKEENTVTITYNKNYTGKVTCTATPSNLVEFAYNEGAITVTGKKPGTVKITVKGEAQGYYLATERDFEVTVTEVPVVPVDIQISGTDLTVGEKLTITHDPEYEGKMTYSAEPENIVSIDENGVVTGLADGNVRITATAEGSRFYTRTITYFDVNVTSEPKGLYLTSVTIPNNGYFTLDGFDIEATFKNNTGSAMDIISNYCKMVGGRMTISSNSVYMTDLENGETIDCVFSFPADRLKRLPQYAAGVSDFAFTFLRDDNKTVLEPTVKAQFNMTLVDKQTVATTISPAGWGTVILPFNATIPEGVTAYSCNAYEDPLLTLTEVKNGKLNMDTPYILKGVAGTYDFSGPQIPNKLDTYSSGLLVGTTKNDTIPTDSYVLDTRDGISAFYKVSGETKQDINAYSVYLTLPESGIATDILYLNKSDYHIKGDVNGDYTVDISDVNAIISVICGGTFNSFADINKDGSVDISDVNAAISIICGN